MKCIKCGTQFGMPGDVKGICLDCRPTPNQRGRIGSRGRFPYPSRGKNGVPRSGLR